MEDKKLKCHFSIIIENSWRILLLCILTFLPDGDKMQEIADIWWIVTLVTLAVLLVIFLFQFIRWKKTTITLEADALIWERATLRRKNLTIGVQNISSINLEQNLFERIIGTSRLKIDTNSLSTAKSTDLNLLFKKKIAEEIKQQLEYRMQCAQEGRTLMEADAETELEPERVTAEYTAGLSDLFAHSLYDFSLGGILLTAGVLASCVVSIMDFVNGMEFENTAGMFWGAVTAVFLIVSFLISILRKFLTYYDFTVGRAGNRILLSYGLLKKKEYSLPVETINALLIKQTLVGRIFRRYNASIECIGVGDENNETAQLTLSLSYEEMLSRVEELLPEYELDGLRDSHPVSPKVFWHKLCGNIYLFIMAAAAFITGRIMETGREYEVCVVGVFLVLAAFNLLRAFLILKTEKTGMGEYYAALTVGSFGRKTVILQYRKIQYLRYTSSPLTHWTGLYKGSVSILSKSSVQTSPMISKEEVEQMKRKCLDCGIGRKI